MLLTSVYKRNINRDNLRTGNKTVNQENKNGKKKTVSLVGCGCRIYRLHLYKGVRPRPTNVLAYDTKQPDCEASVMLELWGMRSTPLLPLLLDSFFPGVVAPDRVLSAD